MSSTGTDLQWFSLTFPPNVELDALLRVVRGWSTRPRGGWRLGLLPLVVEVQYQSGVCSWRLGVSRRDATGVNQALRQVLPAIRIAETTRQLPTLIRGVELKLRCSKRATNVAIADELSTALLLAISNIGVGEAVVMQWLVGPWVARSPVRSGSSTGQDLGWPWRLLDPPSERDQEAAGALKAKQQEHVFGTLGRIAVQAASTGRAQQLIQQVHSAMQLSRAPGVGFVRSIIPSSLVPMRLERCQTPVLEWPCPLNVSELAGVLAWPIGGPNIPGISFTAARPLPAHHRSLIPETMLEPLEDTPVGSAFRPIGITTYPDQSGVVILRPKDALQHLHVLGPTGSGKSHVLANLALTDIATGRATVVIEPTGDLVQAILERIPFRCRDQLVVLDVADMEAPVGLNSLAAASGPHRELVVDQLLSTLQGLWRDSWGPRTHDILHAGLLSLAGQPGASLVSLPHLFTNDTYRRQVTQHAISQDPWGLASFWAWFDGLSPEQRAQVLAPVMNKLRSFLLRPSLRAILGQPAPRFSLHQVFTEKKTLLVNLSAGSIGPEAAALLGSMLVAQLWQLTTERTRIPATQRHPVMVFIDEFQQYLHLPTDLSDVLARSRAMGVSLTMAHQHMGQLGTEIREAVLANARSRVVFRLPAKDARVIADGHPELTAEDISGVGRYEIYASLMTDGISTPFASALTRDLPEPTGRASELRQLSRTRWGVPAATTDAYLRSLFTPLPPTSSDDDQFGIKRRSL